MKINDSIYYTPHQVASFFSIKKDTLLYYDKIGLFCPAIRKENGYRGYSAAQLNELDTILTLRDIGIPIAAIKKASDHLSTPSFLALLENEEKSIKGKIDECNVLLDIVRAIKKSISDAQNAEKDKLYITHFDAIPIIKVQIKNKSTKETSDDEWQKAYSQLMAIADCKHIITVGSIVRKDEAREYLGKICREVYATLSPQTAEYLLPEGDYAYMYFSGSIDNLSPFYSKFLSALDEAKLEMKSDIYEELSISTIVTKDENEHVTKLMVRV